MPLKVILFNRVESRDVVFKRERERLCMCRGKVAEAALLHPSMISIRSDAHVHLPSANVLVRMAKIILDQQAATPCCSRHRLPSIL